MRNLKAYILAVKTFRDLIEQPLVEDSIFDDCLYDALLMADIDPDSVPDYSRIELREMYKTALKSVAKKYGVI